MSAWPEAVYIIKKLNTSIENIFDIEQNILLVDQTNDDIDALADRVDTLSNNYDTFDTTLTELTTQADELEQNLASFTDSEALAEITAAAEVVNDFEDSLNNVAHQMVIADSTTTGYDYNTYSVWLRVVS